MTIELAVIFGIISAVIGLLGFFAGVQTRSEKDGNWRGTVDTKLNAILTLGADLKELQRCFNASSLLLAEHSETLRTIHRRLENLEHRNRKEEDKK